MNDKFYRVTCIITKCCQTAKMDLFVYADDEKSAFKNAKEYAIKIGKADYCKPLKTIKEN